MDLSALRDGLNAHEHRHANADQELLSTFKAAALSITTLYKASLANSKESYRSGYQACLADVLSFMQAGVSIQGQGETVAGSEGLTIGRVMDWVEARYDALKDVESDEDEDKDKAQPQAQSQPQIRIPPPTPTSTPVPTAYRQTPLVTPTSATTSQRQAGSSASTTTGDDERRSYRQPQASVSAKASRQQSPPTLPPHSAKASSSRKDRAAPLPLNPFGISNASPDFPLVIPPSNDFGNVFASDFHQPVVGSKRRHASLMEPAPSSSSRSAPAQSPPTTSRRRARNSRVGAAPSPVVREVTNDDQDAMDVESEERVRKIARR